MNRYSTVPLVPIIILFDIIVLVVFLIAMLRMCFPVQIVQSSKVKGEKELTEKQEKVLIEIEKCHRRVEEFSEYSDLSLMTQYCKEIAG